MKRILVAATMMMAFGAQAIDLPDLSVKDRIRMELWSFGMEPVKLQKSSHSAKLNQPQKLIPEISKPLRELALEL